MKTRILIGLLIILSFSCGKKGSSPTSPSDISYALTDIVGSWTGEAESSINSFTLNLTIDAEGNASGTGAEGDLEISSREWNIDNEGKVTGNNPISIRSAGMLTIEWGHWSLQLSRDKVTLSGEFSSNALGTMDVNMNKQ